MGDGSRIKKAAQSVVNEYMKGSQVVVVVMMVEVEGKLLVVSGVVEKPKGRLAKSAGVSGLQEIYGSGHKDNYEWENEFLMDLTGKMPAIRGLDFMNYNPLYGWDDGTTYRAVKWVKEKSEGKL